MAGPVPFTLDARTSSWVTNLTYNGVRFPPATTAKATFSPVYDKSERFVKYFQAHVTVECVVFAGMLDSVQTSYAPYTGVSTLHYEAATAVNQDTSLPDDYSVDAEINTIRQRLLQPSQELTLRGTGMGDIQVNSPSLPYSADPNNGPKPRILEWVPLTNKLARIRWEVDFCFAPCADTEGQSTIDEFSFSLSLEIGEDGLTTRTITGTYTHPINRVTTSASANPPTGKGRAGGSTAFDLKAIEGFILSKFPMVVQFSRSASFDLSEDRKTVNFRITDKEQGSDNAYGVGCVRESATLSTESSLNLQGDGGGGAFQVWNTSLDGSITLYPGFPKGYALAEMYRLLKRYFTDSVKNANGILQQIINKETAEGMEPSLGRHRLAKGLLTGIRLTDNIFSKNVGFSFQWKIWTTIEMILEATGMFRPIAQTHDEAGNQWGEWAAPIHKIMTTGGWQGLNMTEESDIVVSICDPFKQPKPLDPPFSYKKIKEDREVGSGKRLKVPVKDDKKTAEVAMFSRFKPVFSLSVDNNTLRHSPLTYKSPVSDALDTYPTKFGQKTRYYNPQSNYASDSVHRIGEKRYTLTFAGVCETINAPAQIFSVKSYGGRPVYPIGEDLFVPMKVGTGLDITTGRTYSIHQFMWRRQYAVLLPPLNDLIETDGLTSQQLG